MEEEGKESWEESWVEGRSGRNGNDPAKQGLEWREVSGVITATRLMHTERAPTQRPPTPPWELTRCKHTHSFSLFWTMLCTLWRWLHMKIQVD